MKPFLILIASSCVLIFGSGCMKIQPDSIEPIPNTFTSIEDSLSSNLNSDNSIENTPIYNINELTAGFIKPIKKDNQLTFIDKFIDGEFKDIDYLDRKIKISNCNDLLTYDLRETSNIANSDRNILLIRKRACILIKDITNDSNIIALNDNYKNSKFIPIVDKHLKIIVDSIPSRISENREVNCSIDQYHNVACLYKQKPKEYSLYINQVAIIDDKSYYFITVDTSVPTYYYLTTIDGDKVYSQWIYY